MKDYLMYNNTKYEISEETAEELARIFGNKETTLSDVEVGKTFKIGDMEFIVLEHLDGSTVVIAKDLFCEDIKYGTNNNYDGSAADYLCNDIAQKIADIIGEDNIVGHELDLTANNGMKCYGSITRKVALPTAEQVRKYAYILAEYKIDDWWWLATASGTPKWGTTDYVLCVSRAGLLGIINFSFLCGVRPFCILKSSISVS